jgi:pimeloyl-ACP methyl ester carboxylesterase
VLVQQGYRVIAPDLLGLGGSDEPPEPDANTVQRDMDRTLGVMTALGAEKARIVCHDRGGGIGWNIAAHHPERVAQLVALTIRASFGCGRREPSTAAFRARVSNRVNEREREVEPSCAIRAHSPQ